MSISITLSDIHPRSIQDAVRGTPLENDIDFEMVLMRYLRPARILHPMPNVSSISFIIKMVYKNNSVIVTINSSD